jgi:hydrogenase expression/formation protein HypE
MEKSTHHPLSEKYPLPPLGTEIITLAHGSGGKLTNRLLDEAIFKVLDNETLESRGDGAVLESMGRMAFSTDSFVVSPIFFPGGNIGELAVYGTVNDVAMCGALPKYISLAFIIEEGMPVADLWEVLLSIRLACEKAGVIIATGDTKVVERGSGDQLFINTTGLGSMMTGIKLGTEFIESGDTIIINGNIADHGMAILSKREGLQFESDIVSDTQNLNDLTQEILSEFKEDVKLFRDPTRGGVATVLNEIALQTKLGVNLDASSLPVNKTVASACELFGLDPLYVANEGKLICIVKANKKEEILTAMKNHPKGKDAAIIGTFTKDHPGKVIAKSLLGGSRVIVMPVAEQLPRIC